MIISAIRRRIGEMKLRNKLMFSYFVASIIPIIVISFTIYHLSAKSVEQASKEFASMYISQATTNLNDFVDKSNRITRSVLQETDIMGIMNNRSQLTMEDSIETQKVISGYFGQMSMEYPEIETVMLISADGKIYDYTKAPDKVNTDRLVEQVWYKHIRGSETALFITPIHDKSYYGNSKGDATFTVGRILRNYNGSYAGMILLDMDPVHLINLNEDFLMLGNRYNIKMIITNDEGELIYHSDGATGKKAWKDIIDDKYFADLSRSGQDNIVLSKDAYDGRLRINTEIPLKNLLATINNIKHVTIWSIIVFLFFIALLSILFSYKITKPVLNLRRSMKQVEIGNYTSLIQAPVANDEISNLVKSYNKMIIKIKELIEDVYLAGLKRKQAQFLALQAQINPHMLYNTLESIRMKAVVKEQDDIAEMIKILARMFRHSLGKQREYNLVKHEVEYAANFLFLQNIRYDNRFVLDVRLSDRVLGTPIIPLVFQPIIENSIKHGFHNYDSQLHITIEEEITETGDVLIRITDDGYSMTAEKAFEINELLCLSDLGGMYQNTDDGNGEGGIGLYNIAERIRLQYGDTYVLRVRSDEEAGTVVEMRIPLQDSSRGN
ncbi:histidine kinase [Paenibacillus sp. FSL R7-0048]|nr:sensor histidine kinase [Paenibacillus odorifer]